MSTLGLYIWPPQSGRVRARMIIHHVHMVDNTAKWGIADRWDIEQEKNVQKKFISNNFLFILIMKTEQ